MPSPKSIVAVLVNLTLTEFARAASRIRNVSEKIVGTYAPSKGAERTVVPFVRQFLNMSLHWSTTQFIAESVGEKILHFFSSRQKKP